MMSRNAQEMDDPAQRFRREGLQQCRRGAQLFCAFAGVLLIASAMYSAGYERGVLPHLLYIRLFALAGIAAIFWSLAGPAGERWPRELALAAILVMVANMLALAEWTGGAASPQYDRISMTILASAVMMTWSAGWALLAAVSVIGMYLLHSGLTGAVDAPAYANHLLRMGGAGAITVAACSVRERRRWRELLQVQALSDARRRADAEIRRLNDDLERRVLERTAALRASEGRARALVDAVRTHQEQLAHVLRVTSMGGMVAELAHELNQPLGAIVNFANGSTARLRQSGADPELIRMVARIAEEGMRAAEILRRVREFVRPGGTAREPVDLNELVRDAALLIDGEARRNEIPVHLRLADELPSAPADRIQVEQVILNLIRNALEAMRDAPGGPHALTVETRAAPPGVELRVRDTGGGVKPEHAGRIFEAFFTTKGGLGMGLAISRSIVEAYGGRLWAEPNEDRGMTFGFSLPDAASVADEPTPPAARGA